MDGNIECTNQKINTKPTVTKNKKNRKVTLPNFFKN